MIAISRAGLGAPRLRRAHTKLEAIGNSDHVDARTLIAGLSLVLAIGSLIWQATTYRRSGSRFRVELAFGAIGNGGMVSGPAQLHWDDIAAQGYTQPVLVATIVNVGRLPGTIVKWEIKTEAGTAFLPMNNPIGQTLPARIDHEDRALMAIDLSEVHRLVQVNAEVLGKPGRNVWAVVETASGKRIDSNRIRI